MDNKDYLYQTDEDGNSHRIGDRSFADNEIDLGGVKTAQRYNDDKETSLAYGALAFCVRRK